MKQAVHAILLAATITMAESAPTFAESGRVPGQQVANDRMPFPMLMNSLFGRQRATTYREPSFAQPPRTAAPTPYVVRQRQVTGARSVNLEPAPRTAPSRRIDPKYERQSVPYDGKEKPGTIVIDTSERFLYLVQENGAALRYGVGVGREGFSWRGTEMISRKAEWPDWRPPEEMKKRQPGLPDFMPGGPNNPLGARALYLGSTLYRIHGSNEPWTIGQAVSSGCIRMRNEDVIDLYDRVRIGARVVVL